MTAEGDRAAFLRAILADPDDDGPRLVFADWLDEHGDPGRAEFVRVQCARARLPLLCDDDVRLRRREVELLQQHESAWLAELPDWVHPVPAFRRGFVTEVGAAADAFLKAGGDLLAATPVEHLRLYSVAGRADAGSWLWPPKHRAAAVASSPLLRSLRTLWLDRIDEHGAAALAASPHLDRLRRLCVGERRDRPLAEEARRALERRFGACLRWV